MTEATSAMTFTCPGCGRLLYGGILACPGCGALVYSQRLNELAGEAQRQEMVNPGGAVPYWQQCLPLLPPNSQQYQMVQQRIGALLSGLAHPSAAGRSGPRIRANDPLEVALAKTIGSMIVSVLVYAYFLSSNYIAGLVIGCGLVLLILVHEMGHVIAMRLYGMRAGPPIFIPFVGAVINLRQRPRDALQEAVIGIGGPVLGTVGALVCYTIYLKTGLEWLLLLSFVGFMINLFNMLPVPPLDGGRITAAVSPWIWAPGLLVLLGLLVESWVTRSWDSLIILGLVLLYAWPRLRRTLLGRDRKNPYYNIGRLATWAMGTAYVGLALLLAFFAYRTAAPLWHLHLFQ